MNYEVLTMKGAEKIANYDKLVEENKILKEQRNYYKTEYNMLVITFNKSNREKDREIRRLEKELMEARNEK